MKALASWTSGSRLRADQALLGAHIAAEGGGGRCCSTHTVSWNHLSLWGFNSCTRQGDLCVLGASLVYRVSSGSGSKATEKPEAGHPRGDRRLHAPASRRCVTLG